MKKGIKLGAGTAVGIVIVGVLIGLALLGSAWNARRAPHPRFLAARPPGKRADARVTARADLARLASALENFHLDVGRYPTQSEGLGALRVPPADAPGWKGPYLSSDLRVDPWGHPYIYQVPGPDGADIIITG